MLNEANASHDDLFRHTDRNLVQFHGKVSRLCRDRIDCFIQQISFRRTDFTQSPVGVADKIIAGKGAGCVCGVRCHQLAVLIQTIYRTCETGVALGIPGLSVRLGHFHTEFLQDIGETAFGDNIPLNRRCLRSRNHITDRSIHLFQCIRSASADQHIFKAGHTGRIRYGILIHR